MTNCVRTPRLRSGRDGKTPPAWLRPTSGESLSPSRMCAVALGGLAPATSFARRTLGAIGTKDQGMKDIFELIQRGNDYGKKWELGNSVLYKLCETYKLHKKENEIIAKIWLIGRSYAAAIERRKSVSENIGDDFYISKVVPEILNSNIDDWINQSIHSSDIFVHIKTHKLVTDLFHKISGQDKRSLASKYLHFHVPDKFYIYDTRAVDSICHLIKYLKADRNIFKFPDIFSDEEYKLFYLKCDFIQKTILKLYSEKLDCRGIDNLLLEIANRKLIEKDPTKST